MLSLLGITILTDEEIAKLTSYNNQSNIADNEVNAYLTIVAKLCNNLNKIEQRSQGNEIVDIWQVDINDNNQLIVCTKLKTILRKLQTYFHPDRDVQFKDNCQKNIGDINDDIKVQFNEIFKIIDPVSKQLKQIHVKDSDAKKLLKDNNSLIYQNLKNSILLGSKKPFRYNILFKIIGFIPFIGLPIVYYILGKLSASSQEINSYYREEDDKLGEDLENNYIKFQSLKSKMIFAIYKGKKYRESTSIKEKYFKNSFCFYAYILSTLYMIASISIMIFASSSVTALLLLLPESVEIAFVLINLSLILFSPFIYFSSLYDSLQVTESIGYLLAERKADQLIEQIVEHVNTKDTDQSPDYFAKIYKKIEAFNIQMESYVDCKRFIIEERERIFEEVDVIVSLAPKFAPNGTNTPRSKILELIIGEKMTRVSHVSNLEKENDSQGRESIMQLD